MKATGNPGAFLRCGGYFAETYESGQIGRRFLTLSLSHPPNRCHTGPNASTLIHRIRSPVYRGGTVYTNERGNRMAVGVVMQFPGGTLEQYDEVIARMGLVQGGSMPSGGISHWVTQTDEGLRVTDVWESREQFEHFAQEQIAPITQQAGIPGPPEMTFYDAHNYMLKTPAGIPA
jgi:hypothetical protein